MLKDELLEKVTSLDCLLKCLSSVRDDDMIVLQGMPQALKVASTYSEQIFELVANSKEVE